VDGGRPRAVILGGRGTLGAALVAELPRAGFELVEAPPHGGCDIRDRGALDALCARARPAVVFNAAAYTDVDRAEREPELVHAVDALGAENVARAAAAAGAAVLHYSTDFVFGGPGTEGAPYDERAPPSPEGVYARAKLEGDRRVAAATPRHFVLRVGCLYGRGGRNFPSQVLARLRAGETLRVDRERLVGPTWVRQVAAVSAALARTAHHGLYHATAHGETTWAEFARRCATLIGAPEALVHPVATGELPMKAPRPRRAILDNALLRARGLDGFSPWQEALAAFVAEERRDGRL
jgi:dTDP-4-dehydrorhamnose reductase